MSVPYVFSKIAVKRFYADQYTFVGFAPDGSSNEFYARADAMQELADKLWDLGFKPSAVKAVAEAKPAEMSVAQKDHDDLWDDFQKLSRYATALESALDALGAIKRGK